MCLVSCALAGVGQQCARVTFVMVLFYFGPFNIKIYTFSLFKKYVFFFFFFFFGSQKKYEMVRVEWLAR